jgi:hypothetical protein
MTDLPAWATAACAIVLLCAADVAAWRLLRHRQRR